MNSEVVVGAITDVVGLLTKIVSNMFRKIKNPYFLNI